MKTLRSTISIGFALLVLMASSSFSVGLHICSGQLKNIALFGKADGCEKEKQLPPCHRHSTQPCCEDETVIHDSEDFHASASHLDLSPQTAIDIVLPQVILAEIVSTDAIRSPRYYNYDPPLRSCDRTVAHSVFLI